MTNLIEIKRDVNTGTQRFAIVGIENQDYIVEKSRRMIKRMAIDNSKVDYLMGLPSRELAWHINTLLGLGDMSGFKEVEQAIR